MNQHKILFVDDEQYILNALCRLFRNEGYELLTASGGEEGLEVLRKESVAVVISDHKMPGMTGVEFLQQAKDVSPDTIRIILSGYVDVKAILSAVNTGEIYRFITKPWDDGELKTLVRRSIDHYDLIRENQVLTDTVHEQNEMLLELNGQLEQKVEERTKELHLRNVALQFSREVLDNLPVAVIGISLDGTIVLVNGMANEVHGSSEAPLMGQGFARTLPDEVARLVESTMTTSRADRIDRYAANGRSVDILTAPLPGPSAARGVILVSHHAR